MNTYALIETRNVLGKVAYVETISQNENILKYKEAKTISIYRTKKEAVKQAETLNEIYKKQKEDN